MNRGFLNSSPVPPRNDLERKLLEIRFADLSIETIESDVQVESTIRDHVPQYVKLVTKLVDAQKKLEDIRTERENLLEMSKKFSKSPKLKDIIDEYISQINVPEAEGLVKECARHVASYRDIFSLCKNVDVLNRYICYVCLSRPVDTFLYACGHVMCEQCSTAISSQCPFCRVTIREKLKIFGVS